MSAYSLIEHIAKIAWGGRFRSGRLAMFTAYFDASGDIHSSEALALAGFVGSAESWIDWEEEWLARLKLDGLDCFHRSELAERLGEAKKRKLLQDLAEIIASHGFWRFGAAIINEDVRSLTTKKERDAWHINSYSYAGRCAAVELREWSVGWSGPFPQMVFERGDKGRDQLTRLLSQDGYPEPLFKPKRDQISRKTGILENGAVPLQAADLYAFDLFDRARNIVRGKKVSKNFSHGINPTIERLLGRSGIASPDQILFMKEGLEHGDALIVQPSVKIDTKTLIR